MADRIAVLRQGRVMQVGSPRPLYDRPNCRFVADFLGETNFLSAVVDGTDDRGVVLETPAGRLTSAAGVAETPQGGNVTCSIRPEALTISADRTPINHIAGRHRQTVYLGEMAQHLVEIADGSLLKVETRTDPVV